MAGPSKACNKCREEKPLGEFYSRKDAKDGCTGMCKECTKAKTKSWQENNRSRKLAYLREWRERNPDYMKKWEKENQERRKEKRREWVDGNREHLAGYYRSRRQNDELYAIRKRLSNRARKAFYRAGYTEKSSIIEIVGCTWEHLRDHIEKQFSDGMGWDNRQEWHIDHIIPLSSASTKEEIEALCHYTNLQPLWEFDNKSKGAKILRAENDLNA